MKKWLLIPIICLACINCNSNKQEQDFIQIDQSQVQNTPDWKISLAVKYALLNDSSLSFKNRTYKISVSTTNGTVTLQGNVESKDQMRKVLRTVASVDGVISIDNQLIIKD